MKDLDFVFVHSYTSAAPNWEEVMIGKKTQRGRLTRAMQLARGLGLRVVANDANDQKNQNLYMRHGFVNLGTANNTNEEIISALSLSPQGRVLFVSSPDHLPRIVRDTMANGATHALFAASDVAFSEYGANEIQVLEPAHKMK